MKGDEKMSRFKFLVSFLVVATTLIWPLSVLAQSPDTCFPECYVSNHRIPGTTDAQDGTSRSPWVAPTESERTALRQDVAEYASDEGSPGSLTLITCSSAQATDCAYVVYEYDAEGNERAQEPKPGIPPEVGVLVPLPYLLGGGLVLGMGLIGLGIFLRRRVLRQSS
jgi:hypothetical protein